MDFKNTVVIMTSNVGSQHIQEFIRKDPLDLKNAVMAALRAQFRPEFLNRLDDMIIFNPLSLDQIKQIVEIQILNLQGRLADRKISLSLTDRAKEMLAQQGYDPVYGARPLKRVIQRDILSPLATRLMDGTFKDGDRIEVDANGQGFKFGRT